MGGWSGLEYAFANPTRVRALGARLDGRHDCARRIPVRRSRADAGLDPHTEAAVAVLMAKNIHVAAGERLARIRTSGRQNVGRNVRVTMSSSPVAIADAQRGTDPPGVARLSEAAFATRPCRSRAQRVDL